MEDNGGEMFVSQVDPEIREAMRKVIKYLEDAHNIKAKKVNFKKFKKSTTLWFSPMSADADKDFLAKISNQKYKNTLSSLFWLWLKWLTFSSDHTLVALFTAFFERFNMRRDSEVQLKLKREGQELKQEYRVRV